MFVRALLFAFGMVAIVATAQSAGMAGAVMAQSAQQAAPDPQSLSPEAVHDMVARLSDQEVRALLLQRLDREAQPPTEAVAAETVINAFAGGAVRVRAGLSALVEAAPRLPAEVGAAVEKLRDGRPHSVFALIALAFAAMMVGGWVLEWLYGRAVGGVRSRLAPTGTPLLGVRVGLLFVELLLSLVGIALFAAGAVCVFFLLWQGHVPTREVVAAFLSAVVVLRVLVALSKFLLAPASPALRVPSIDDDAARAFHLSNIRVATLATLGLVACSSLLSLGISRPVYLLLAYVVATLVFALIARAVWRQREAVSADLLGPPEAATPARTALAGLWPYVTTSFTVALLIIIIVLSLADVRIGYVAAFGTLLTVHFLPHLDAAIARAIALLQQGVSEEGLAMGSGRIVLMRAARIFVVVVGVLFLAGVWGADPLAYMSGTGVAAALSRTLVDIGLTIVVAYILWAFTCITIDRKLADERAAAEASGEPVGEIGGTGLSRLATLLPIVRLTLQVTIIVITGLMVLSALGVNIGPLLAGAGVVGLAVGFGAQTLVRDIVSGVFFLLDDAFRVGEYIDIGTVKGSVEKISVRSVRLRHHRGALHTVPFGEIKRLTNYSRDWAIMKLEFRIPFDADLEKVRKIFKRIGQELLEDEELAPLFLEPFKSQGVVSSDDSAWIIRGKFMAKPGGQFLIRRKAYAAVQEAFAEAGLHFADRRVTVNVPDAERLTPAQVAAAGAAGASSIAAPAPGTTTPDM